VFDYQTRMVRLQLKGMLVTPHRTHEMRTAEIDDPGVVNSVCNQASRGFAVQKRLNDRSVLLE